MPITITLEPDQAEVVVATACGQHAPAEVRFLGPNASPLSWATRLLTTDPDGLHIERPVGPDGPVEPAKGQQARVTFNRDGRRYALEAAVNGSGALRLDAKATVDALALTPPQRVCELQRRSEYRVPLWSSDPVMAHFEPLPISDAEETSLSEPFHAELQNVSAGGVAALVNPSVRASLARGQHFMMEFFLPGCEDAFTFAVRVQHIRRLKHNDARLLGLKFAPGDDHEATRRSILQIRSFVDVHRRLKT